MFDCPFLFASDCVFEFVFVLDIAQAFNGRRVSGKGFSFQRGIHLLGAQGKGRTGDARRQMQALDDLLPQLLVDDIHQSAAGYYQIVQLIEIQHRFGHYGQPIDRRSCNRYTRYINI